MARIKCTLVNASTLINGIQFEPGAGGMISVDEVTPAQAERFASIPGYEIIPGEKNPSAEAVDSSADEPSKQVTPAEKSLEKKTVRKK